MQPEKAELPILVTPSGIVTEVKPVQPEKAELPILVTPSGIVTEVKPVQPEKAELPILVTDSGMVIEVSLLIFRQRLAGICSTLSPNTNVSILSAASWNRSSSGLLASQFRAFHMTEVKPVQPEKAQVPILVTNEGIVTEVKPVQSEKAKSPILVTGYISPL